MKNCIVMDFYKYPVLYDVCTKVNGKVIKNKKGFYDYERDIFSLPSRVYKEIEKNYPNDLEVIRMVGYEVVT